MELLEEPERANELGAAARQLIDREFSLRVVVDRYVELYRAMIDGRWPRAPPSTSVL